MGQHTEEFRLLIAGYPKTSNGLTPELARKIIIQVTNQALQVIVGLEEAIEDKDREIERLTDMLISADATSGNWSPKDGA